MAYDKLDDYVGVHKRIELFRKEHPQGRILTAIFSQDPLIFRAEVYFTDSEVPNAAAHASEEGGMGNRAKSAVEKTETAAVGRALAFCGYEIKEGIASREEAQKPERPVPISVESKNLDRAIGEACGVLGKTEDQLLDWVGKKYKVTNLASLGIPQKREVLKFLQGKIDEAKAKTA